MIQRHALALCESCDGCGTTEGDLRNRDCQDCLGTGYAHPQKRILNLQSEISETRHELDSWAKQCESNMALLKDALATSEEAIKQRDTLAEAISQWRRKSWKDCKCDHGYDGRMPLQGEKCERCRLWDAVDLALAAVKGGLHD